MEYFQQMGPNAFVWSAFSEEKGLFFNGTCFRVGGRSVLIDPVEMSKEQIEEVRSGGAPEAILLTNKDHRRAAFPLKDVFKIPVGIHEADGPFLEHRPDFLFKDYDRLPLGLAAIHLPAMKSPGETAFFFGAGGGTMVLGDALIGAPPGSLKLLPREKIADPDRAKASLKRLLDFRFETLIVGDGQCLERNGREAIATYLSRGEN